MQRQELLTRLKALQLHGRVRAFEELAAEACRRELPVELWRARLREAESAERQVRYP